MPPRSASARLISRILALAGSPPLARAGLALLALAVAAAPARDSTQGQSLIQEMRSRRVVAPDAAAWTPDEYTLLLRLREAEKLGAFAMLRERMGTLKGYAVEQAADGYNRLLLTREGYGMFIFVKSQGARAYFESKGHEAKDVLLALSNLRGDRLFDRAGTLTQAGDEIYNRVGRGLPAFWRDRDGRINGNARPPRDGSLPPGERGPAAPVPQSPQEAQALRKLAALTASGYVEISEAEALDLAQTSKRSLEQLGQETSLQVVRASDRTYYLLSPSDPLMTLVARARSGDRTRSRSR